MNETNEEFVIFSFTLFYSLTIHFQPSFGLVTTLKSFAVEIEKQLVFDSSY